MAVIEAEGLRKTYGSRVAVGGLDLEVPRGCRACLRGRAEKLAFDGGERLRGFAVFEDLPEIGVNRLVVVDDENSAIV